MTLREESIVEPLQGTAFSSGAGASTGVLVLAGSSGRIDSDRARLLARYGALALALRWFGGPGQSSGICEIPLETFTLAIDWLHQRGCHNIGIVGLSKGAEAALLVAVRDPRVDAVVAISPSAVVWANVGPGLDGMTYPYRSSWRWHDQPLPFVPYGERWEPPTSAKPMRYRSLYEASLRAFPDAVAAATIPIEVATGIVLLVAGGDDAMWPSRDFADTLAVRRRVPGRPVELVTHPDAGHRPIFPGEALPAPSTHTAYGGSPEADAELGGAAWPRVLACLHLD
jgi:hypothetical protein